MLAKLFLFPCFFILKLSFVLCTDIIVQNETVNYPCDLKNSVVITYGEISQNDSIVYNDILYSRDQYFSINVNGTEQIRGCPCLVHPCIPICCHFGKMSSPGYVEDNYTVEIPVYEDTTLLDGYKINTEYFETTCVNHRERGFHLQKNGSLLIMESKMPTIYTRYEYCIDFVALPDEVEGAKYQLEALLCFPELENDKAHENKIKILSRCMLISVPFLVATLVVYCILPELHNLPGYIMMTYLSCFISFFLFLAAAQISTGEYKVGLDACLFLDFAIYFTSMASFFWMNVMCCDIWWTFSGEGSWHVKLYISAKKRYIFYSIYAWSIPTLLTCFLAYMQFKKDQWDDYITPGFGLKNFWFQDNNSQLLYMYLPIGILLACNVVLFSTTTFKIFSISRESRMLEENLSKKILFKKERQRFFLYLKLLTVMGLNWILEIVSFLINNESESWIVSDVFNCLMGVFIFIIFVLKKRILNLLVERYMPCFGKKTIKQNKSTTTSRSLGNSAAIKRSQILQMP